MSRKSYNLGCLTKVEGHAKLYVEMDGKTVKKAEISVFEPSRYFEHMVLGKRFDEVPTISQRICGICSVVHTVTSVKAVENATGIRPSKQTADLRKLLLYASNIHSHTAHLFFFAASDYMGVDDVIELSRKHRNVMELAIELQRTSSGIVKLIGGRALHPVNCRVGHFNSVPDAGKVKELKSDFMRLKEMSEKTARLFMTFRNPEFENRSEYVSLVNDDEYPLYDGMVCALGRMPFRAEDYGKRIEEETIRRSTAKYASIYGKPYMTGALARFNNNHEKLSPSARKLLKESGLKMPCFSTFANNLMQAIEMVHSADAALEILGRYGSGMKDEKRTLRPRKGEGVAACEAPRGTLFHHYRFDSKGMCTYANIVTPTCQNVRNMENDINALLPSIIGKTDEKVKRALEMLIRAYDPCFSCSTHFLELRMKR